MSKLNFFDNYIDSFGLKGLNKQIYQKGFLRGSSQDQVYSVDIETSLCNVTEDVKIVVLTTEEDERKKRKYKRKQDKEQRKNDDLKIKDSEIFSVKNSLEREKIQKSLYLGQSLRLKKKIYKGTLEWQKTKPSLFSRHFVKNQFLLLNDFYSILKILKKGKNSNQNIVLKSALALKEQRGGFVLSYFGMRGFMPTSHFNTLCLYSIFFSKIKYDLTYQSIFNFFKNKNIFRIYFSNFEISKKVRFVKNISERTNLRKKNKRFLVELENWDKIWNKKRKKMLRKKERKNMAFKFFRLKLYIIFYLNKSLLKLTKKLLKSNAIFFRKKKLLDLSKISSLLRKKNKFNSKNFISLSNKYFKKK